MELSHSRHSSLLTNLLTTHCSHLSPLIVHSLRRSSFAPLKICANHLILPTMSVQEHAGNEKSCVWHARDFADGELKDELFCIRFPSIENCKSFMETFQEVAESQNNEDEKESSAAAGLIEKLSVEEKADAEKKEEEKSEDKTGEQESAKESKADADKKVEEPASSA